MSSLDLLEPPMKGKVLLQTTAGPLVIELWPKEAPMAARNFVQLYLEGYYDGTIFHRVIKNFIVQGGDPRGDGTGGESVYGAPFADEFHSLLKFNKRGLVACANAGTPHSNGSQFFITLDCCDSLDRKHTIFGKLMCLAQDPKISCYACLVETYKNYRLVLPQKILSVKVLWDPFEDIVLRPLKKAAKDIGVSKKAVNVLSHGDEVGEENEATTSVQAKINSIRDVLDDPWSKEQEEMKKDTPEDPRTTMSMNVWTPVMKYGSFYNEDDKQSWESDLEFNEKDIDGIWNSWDIQGMGMDPDDVCQL